MTYEGSWTNEMIKQHYRQNGDILPKSNAEHTQLSKGAGIKKERRRGNYFPEIKEFLKMAMHRDKPVWLIPLLLYCGTHVRLK